MRRVKTKSLPEHCVRLTPRAYAMLHTLASQSRRPVSDLLTSAVCLFVTSTRHLNMMNPPALTPKPLPREQRSPVPPISGTVQRAVRKLRKGMP